MNKSTIHLFLLSLGILLTSLLVMQEYSPGAAGCIGIGTLSEGINCASVAASDPLQQIGLKSSVIGAIYFWCLYLLTGWIFFEEEKRQKSLNSIKKWAIWTGFGFMTLLTIYHLFWLDSVCLYCLGVFFVILMLALSERFLNTSDSISGRQKAGSLAGSLCLIILPFIVSGMLQSNLSGFVVPSCRTVAELSDSVYHNLLENGLSEGNNDAEITIIEFFSPSCIHCREFYPELKRLEQTYAGSIQFVYVPLVLTSSDPLVYNALYVADESNRSHELLDLVLTSPSSQDGFTRDQMKEHLAALGLASEANLAKVDSGYYNDRIASANRTAQHIGIRSTPTVALNGALLADYRDLGNCLASNVEL